MDEKGLIPDNNPLLKDKDQFVKVNHEQTKTYLHHADDLGNNFNMTHYEKLD